MKTCVWKMTRKSIWAKWMDWDWTFAKPLLWTANIQYRLATVPRHGMSVRQCGRSCSESEILHLKCGGRCLFFLLTLAKPKTKEQKCKEQIKGLVCIWTLGTCPYQHLERTHLSLPRFEWTYSCYLWSEVILDNYAQLLLQNDGHCWEKERASSCTNSTSTHFPLMILTENQSYSQTMFSALLVLRCYVSSLINKCILWFFSLSAKVLHPSAHYCPAKEKQLAGYWTHPSYKIFFLITARNITVSVSVTVFN